MTNAQYALSDEPFIMEHARKHATRYLIVALMLFAAALHSCARRPPAPTPRPAAPPPVAAEPTPNRRTFLATAYSIEGTTASGKETRRGIVAADPKVLPIGARIRVTDAGAYSGTYTVLDTGRAIKGREIDLYIPDAHEARRFGRRHVQVEVLDTGGAK